jgi:hypothetical protein
MPEGRIYDATMMVEIVCGQDAQWWMGRNELTEYIFWIIYRGAEAPWPNGLN